MTLLFIGFAWLWSAPCSANPGNYVPEKLCAGIIDIPPFIMQNPSGAWGDLGCDLLHALPRNSAQGWNWCPSTVLSRWKKIWLEESFIWFRWPL